MARRVGARAGKERGRGGGGGSGQLPSMPTCSLAHPPTHPHTRSRCTGYRPTHTNTCPPPRPPPPPPCSRCTGYRPILDAFRAFAKSDPAAYSEEAIAANKANGGSAPPPATNGANGHAKPTRICPSSGQPCGCGEVADGEVVSSTDHKEGACGPLAPKTM